jgi:hypothetical protein
MTGLIVWLAVAAGSLLVIAFGASLAMQPRGRPFGDDTEMLTEREALTPWQRLPDLPESAYPPNAVPLDIPDP